MREQDALRIARAARGVLNERRIARSPLRPQIGDRPLSETVERRDVLEGRNRGAQQRGDPERLRECHQDPRGGIPEDDALAVCVLFDLVRPDGRINRHGHSAGDQRAKEGSKERHLCTEHERDGVASPDAQRAKTGADPLRRGQQLAVADRCLRVVLAKMDVYAIGCSLGMPVQDVDERRGELALEPSGAP